MPLCSFRTWMASTLPLHLQIKGLLKGKLLPRYGKKKAQSDLVTFPLSPLMVMHYLFVLLSCFWVSLVLCFTLFNMFLFVCFQFCFILFFIKFFFFFEKLEKYKNSVCFVYIGTCVAIEIEFSKLCISCSLDEHLNAQLSKWALWLMFVMSTIKWSIPNTHITLFYGND